MLCVCVWARVCVCVHHINRSGPNRMIVHLEKHNAVADPVRGLPDRREKGKQKEPPRGKNCKSECENISQKKRNQKYPIQWEKTKQNRNRDDDNRHKRTRTRNRGAGRNAVLAMKRGAQWRSNYSRYRRTGQTESKTSFNTATSGDSWY